MSYYVQVNSLQVIYIYIYIYIYYVHNIYNIFMKVLKGALTLKERSCLTFLKVYDIESITISNVHLKNLYLISLHF